MSNDEREKLLETAYRALEDSDFNSGIVLPTGVGKSSILIRACRELVRRGAKKILYCCDNKRLRDEDFPNELRKWGEEGLIDIIDMYCYQSAYKFRREKYDVLLLDEGDSMLNTKYEDVLKHNHFKHIILVSATLTATKRKAAEKYVPISFEIKMDEIEGLGIVNEAEGWIVNIMLNPEENKKYLAYNYAFRKMMQDGIKDRGRLEAIQRARRMFMGSLDSSRRAVRTIVNKLLKDPNNKVLIFCGFSDTADKVCDYSYHSLNSKDNTYLDDFDAGLIRELAVCDKINRGVNLVGVNNAIFESLTSSATRQTQKSGRLRRLPIEEKCNLYFIIPHFRDSKGNIKPTIVQKYLMESTKDLGITFKNYKL